MGNLLLAEWMKVRTRWLPYMLILFLVIGAAVEIWLFGLVAYYDERNDGASWGFYTFRLPYSLVALLDSGQYWGPIFIAFFTASTVATEYNWGTARNALTRGQTRAQYMWAKLLATALMCSAGMLLVLGIGVLFSIGATLVWGGDIRWDVPGGPSAAEVPVMIGRAALAILPYGMLAFALTVISRSTALGATAVLIYSLIESAAQGILGSLGGRWADWQNVFIGHHAAAVMAPNRIGSIEYNSVAFREIPDPSKLQDPWVSAVTLVLYSIAFGAAAFWIFHRRDVRLGTGE